MLKILTLLLAVMFPFGLIIMLTDFGSWYLWTTTFFICLQALILFILLNNACGVSASVMPAVIIIIFSFFIEFTGVRSGYPFGNYSYSEILVPQVLGVPLAIAFAWFSVTVSSYLIAAGIYGKTGAFSISLISSALIFSTDILLEPFASFVNGFWIWDSGKIPIQNFISWLVIGFLFSLVLSLFIKPEKLQALSPFSKKIPYIILTVNVLNFLALIVINGYLFMSVVGTTIIIFILFLLPVIAKNET